MCMFVTSVFSLAGVCTCMCDQSGGSRQAPREFFNLLRELVSFTLKWESGRASLWTVCFFSIEKPQLLLSSSHTRAYTPTRMHTHTHTHMRAQAQMQTRIRYMGICSAAGHTVCFLNCRAFYALVKGWNCVCVCVYAGRGAVARACVFFM